MTAKRYPTWSIPHCHSSDEFPFPTIVCDVRRGASRFSCEMRAQLARREQLLYAAAPYLVASVWRILSKWDTDTGALTLERMAEAQRLTMKSNTPAQRQYDEHLLMRFGILEELYRLASFSNAPEDQMTQEDVDGCYATLERVLKIQKRLNKELATEWFSAPAAVSRRLPPTSRLPVPIFKARAAHIAGSVSPRRTRPAMETVSANRIDGVPAASGACKVEMPAVSEHLDPSVDEEPRLKLFSNDVVEAAIDELNHSSYSRSTNDFKLVLEDITQKLLCEYFEYLNVDTKVTQEDYTVLSELLLQATTPARDSTALPHYLNNRASRASTSPSARRRSRQ